MPELEGGGMIDEGVIHDDDIQQAQTNVPQPEDLAARATSSSLHDRIYRAPGSKRLKTASMKYSRTPHPPNSPGPALDESMPDAPSSPIATSPLKALGALSEKPLKPRLGSMRNSAEGKVPLGASLRSGRPAHLGSSLPGLGSTMGATMGPTDDVPIPVPESLNKRRTRLPSSPPQDIYRPAQAAVSQVDDDMMDTTTKKTAAGTIQQRPVSKAEAERRRKVFSVIDTFRRHANGQELSFGNLPEFIYMRTVQTKDPNAFNPYDLEIVEYSEVDPEDYYTLSPAGIIHYLHGIPEFGTLDQWVREHYIFHNIRDIRLFRQYRSWKNFTLWKKSVRRKKMNWCKSVLKESLFVLNPVHRAALLTTRDLCNNVTDKRLFDVVKGATYPLNEFVDAQLKCKEEVSVELHETFDQIKETIRQACEAALANSLGHLSQAEDQEGEDGDGTPRPGAAIALLTSGQKMSYTESAKLRTECRKLVNFIRVVDYLIVDSLLRLVMLSVEGFLEIVRYKEPVLESDDADKDAPPTLMSKLPPGLMRMKGEPIFFLEVLYEDEGLEFAPKAADFHEAIELRMADFINVVCGVERLITNEDFKPYTQPSINGLNDIGDVSEGPNLRVMITDDDHYQTVAGDIVESLGRAFESARDYTAVFETYVDMYLENCQLNPDGLKDVDDKENIEVFEQTMVKYYGQIENFDEIPIVATIGIIGVDSKKLKDFFLPSPQTCLDEVQAVIPVVAQDKNQELLDELMNANDRLSVTASNVEEFVEYVTFLTETDERMESFDERFLHVKNMFDLMKKHTIEVSEEQTVLFVNLKSAVNALKGTVQYGLDNVEEQKNSFAASLEEEIPDIHNDTLAIKQQSDNPALLNIETDMEEALKIVRDLDARMQEQNQKAARFKRYQETLRVPVATYEDLDELNEELGLKKDLWESLASWGQLTRDWQDAQFDQIDVEEINKYVQQYQKTALKGERNLEANSLVPHFKQLITNFKDTMPVVQDLRNPALLQRHWDQIETLIETPIISGEEFTLGWLIERNVMKHKDAIAVISTEATQESVLEQMIGKVKKSWADAELTVIPHKDSREVFILGGVEEVTVLLDDSLVTVQTILGSRYVAPMRDHVEAWEKNLKLFAETLDEWLAVQRNWLYLEPIFSAPDIQRQLPNEAKSFNSVDKSWKDIMKRAKDNPNALKCGTQKHLLETLQSHNAVLDKVQKQLEEYLETKRMAFPRFYFLSNDELLEILAQAKNPQAVQPHLRKCFDNIYSLDFGPDPASIVIYSMRSGEGEDVQLSKNLKARGSVENWLQTVEEDMVKSLRRLAKIGWQDYPTKPRHEWVLQHPGQIVSTISIVYWVAETEEALALPDPVQGMKDFLQLNKDRLSKLAELVRGDLTVLQRLILSALITVDVHARDIIDELAEEGITSSQDFGWQKQLKYYWDTEIDDCVIRQSNSRFLYGYEYMGCTTRLVITPLTDRCWMTITGALRLKLGSAPAGPAGTGKTESTKDLAKSLARQCVVFNCSDQIDYKMMGKLFSGLAQSGSWTCLDEFNRIDIEVLSVVAQQLLTIRNALLDNAERFTFEGHEIPMKPTCGVFITMNPGYAGRTELPDNLKVLFRPVAMMIPDYGLIAEIMLFSEGFEYAKVLSQKMVKMYKLASEQLSKQDHYDFGMRAVKSVLVMAGALKRSNPDLSEDVVLIRALRDSNIPKFLADDLPLFQAIIKDLFPTVHIPDNDYGELLLSIQDALTNRGYQQVDDFITKVIQLFETMVVRFGVMLVGPTGGGKTACYETLQQAQILLREERNSSNQQMQITHTSIMNPKCVTMGELYGEFDLNTHEWSDGLLSTYVRTAVGDTTSDRKWIVLDGPVDALWIENMNTVLDDNMTLCLANGERIKLNKTMSMLFEVEDLAVASPATVSRCGMVYVEATVGWRAYVLSWMPKLPKEMPETAKKFLLEEGFDAHFDSGLDWVKKAKCSIPGNEMNYIASFCSIFESLCTAAKGVNFGEDPEELNLVVSQLFTFAYTWSLGGNLDADGMSNFDDYVRDFFDGFGSLPPMQTIYDYTFDTKNKQWVPWNELVPEFKYDSKLPYFQLVVPTIDTTRYSFLLSTLLDVEKPALFNGESGVGKTVIMSSELTKQSEGNVNIVNVNFSAQTSSLRTQEGIEAKLDKKRKTTYGAPPGRRICIFVDDVNMPLKEFYGAQPPIELLRQYLDFKGFYDRKKLFWKEIQDVTLVGACGPPGGGRQVLTPRFVRHFNLICVPKPSEDTLKKIFSSILDGFLQPFPGEMRALTKPVIVSSVEVYNRISLELLPTPAKSHYTFNLRDLSKVFQGVLQAQQAQLPSKDALVRLWMHECLRVFHDRLINKDDRRYFTEMLAEMLKRHLNLDWSHEDVFEGEPLMWGDYNKMGLAPDEKVYEEVKSLQKTMKLFGDYLDDYNVSTTKPMNLVFFQDAVEHVSRINRIIRQPRGNAMLVGVGGSGKQSLTRMACAISECVCTQIELTRGYGQNEFREDLKGMFLQAGVEGKPVVFLFTDTQIVKESFLEDINNVLNSGEIPNLFPADEVDKIVNDIRPWVKEQGIPDTKDNCYKQFVLRVRDNLHIVLCMSPVGDAFRARCRQFPSLINCCTIDWFDEWSQEALQSVSNRFLESVPLDSEEVRGALAEMCKLVHTSVRNYSAEFYEELRRRNYTTPTSYLELINLYLAMLKEKRGEIEFARDRLANGLNKLIETNAMVDNMQEELTKLQPVLTQKSADAEELLKRVAIDQEEADKVKTKVEADEAVVKQQADETELVAADARADLDKALPALDSAVKALNALDKKDITEMKSFAKPPALVQTVMEAVCVLLGSKTDWDAAKKLLGDPNFMQRLINYDKDNIPEPMLKKLRKYTDMPEFQPATIEKVSTAAKSLCMWARAMDVYSMVAKEVGPKRERLAAMEAKLSDAKAVLKEKQDELQAVVDNVEQLQRTLENTMREKQELQEAAETTEKRLVRAEKLTVGLADEQERWQQTVELLNQDMTEIVGSAFLSAACVAYYGAFTGEYRKRLVDIWLAECNSRGIPVNPKFTLTNTMGDPVQIREWQIAGLPADDYSTENGILVTRGRRWPLMIDPQGQANRWIKNAETKNNLKLTKLTDANMLRTLENAIRVGSPVLLEDIEEKLDASLEPILQKQVYKQGGRTLIRVGDNDVDYDEHFKFYITTKLPNPHYLPEICIKVTLVNFTVTLSGLEDQLLADVVKSERPDLEEQKVKIVLAMAADKKQLKEIEDKILHLLKVSEGNILDDEVLINTLDASKVTSNMIKERVKEGEETEIQINISREKYRPVATRGSILYFIVAALANIDPMYQYSLVYFKMLFNRSMATSEKSDDIDKRLDIMSNAITGDMYANVCRGLFERHKGVFSFLIGIEIQKHAGDIQETEWGLFLRGVVVPPETVPEAPTECSWMTEQMWLGLALMESFGGVYEGLCEKVKNNLDFFDKYFVEEEPFNMKLPADLDDTFNEFQKLLLVKIIRPEKVTYGAHAFVLRTLGKKFVESPPTNLEVVFPDCGTGTPIVFVLSTGADPTASLLRFAKDRSMMERLHMISLGQGQGPIAEKLIEKCTKNGDWVCLQNCHLAISWMLSLSRIVENLTPSATNPSPPPHENFRLFLTSMPTPKFPVPVLQTSVKLTNEPPKGLRANVLRSYSDMTDSQVEGCDKDPEYRKLLFGLCFFHATLQERRKFGPLGWNIRYEFNDSDLETSMLVLRMFLDEQPEVPYKALTYVVGQINYGGRVTDDWDRRLLMSTLRIYVNPKIMDDSYKFSSSGLYYAPAYGDRKHYVNYCDALPFADYPETFGLHANANISFQAQETATMTDTLLAIQPRSSGGGGGMSRDEVAGKLGDEILEELPKNLERSEAGSGTFETNPETGLMNSLSTVLLQEMMRFNNLLVCIRKYLVELAKAIKGLVVMSADLDEVASCLFNNQVPPKWAASAYPSLKPLSAWVKDLHERIRVLREWLQSGTPDKFWLPGFFFPQGFMTGALQNHARKTLIPIDELNYGFSVTKMWPEDIDEAPEDGVYCYGFFMDGARWDLEKGEIEDSRPGELFSTVPVIHFKPVRKFVPDPRDYACPLYKTSVRAGTLSTTGHSTNFILPVYLPTSKDCDYWVLKGCAMLTMPD